MHFPITSPINDTAREFISSSLERLYKVTALKFGPQGIDAQFGEPVSDDEFIKTMKTLIFISRSVDKDVLFEQHPGSTYRENPQSQLESRGDVLKIAPGCYGLQGNFLKVCRALQDQVMDLAMRYQAVEQEFPPLWPIDLFKSINYFSDYPHQVILTTSPRENHAAREQFANTYRSTNDFERIAMSDQMEPAAYGLSTMVCGCCYYTLRNQTCRDNKIYTTYNKVFRNERSAIDSLDRLTAFSVRDIVFVGEADFVLETRQRLIDDLCNLLRGWQLECKVETANDPFFSNDAMYKNIYQYKHRTKYELLAKLPFCDRHIAVGSINLHLDHYGKAFEIKDSKGNPIHSGCIGIGFERLTYALYAQYGPDETQWPLVIRRDLGLG